MQPGASKIYRTRRADASPEGLDQSTFAFCTISGATLGPLISPPTRSAIIEIAPNAQHAMIMKKPLFDEGFVIFFCFTSSPSANIRFSGPVFRFG
jgi:hypothetical protein